MYTMWLVLPVFVTSTVSPVIAYTNPYLDVVEGSDVDLNCVVVQGNPTPTIHWQKGGKVNTLENSFDELDTYESKSYIKRLLLYLYIYLDYHFSWINSFEFKRFHSTFHSIN